MRKFEDFFDPLNREHVMAYNECCKSGAWPEGFIPTDVYVDYTSHIIARSAMAYEWMRAVIIYQNCKVSKLLKDVKP